MEGFPHKSSYAARTEFACGLPKEAKGNDKKTIGLIAERLLSPQIRTIQPLCRSLAKGIMKELNCKLIKAYQDEENTSYDVLVLDDDTPFKAMSLSVRNDTKRGEKFAEWCKNDAVVIFKYGRPN